MSCPVSWLLYEKPGFQGRSIALEEGPAEIANEWAETEPNGEMGPNSLPLLTTPMVIGSIRLALRVSQNRESHGSTLDLSTLINQSNYPKNLLNTK